MSYVLLGAIVGIVLSFVKFDKSKLTEFEKWQLKELFRVGRHI